MKNFTNTADKQKGVTLVVAMVMLIVLMLLGISAMTVSNIMSRLAGNVQFQNEALNRAETALANGEEWLLSGTNSQNSLFTTVNAATTDLPLYDPTTTPSPLTSWPSAASSVDTAGTEQFYIQKISPDKICPPGENCLAMPQANVTPPSQFYLYRVTAKGTSVRGATRIVESVVQVVAP